jgi:hypothetical protein
MNSADLNEDDDLRPEYAPSTLTGEVRGKHLERHRAGTNLALLAPDAWEAFPTDEEANRALRALLPSRHS